MNRLLTGHILLPLHERLLGRNTFSVFRRLRKSQWLSPEDIAALQLDKLRELIRTAMKHVPHYAQLTGLGENFQPKSLADFRQLPFMDKTMINAFREALVNRDVPGGPIPYSTGGSTGEPMRFYIDRRRQSWDRACRMRGQSWFDCWPGEKQAYIWNSPVELTGQTRLKRIRDAATNEMLLPASDLSAESIGRFVETLRRFKPKSLYGYPSAMALMCRLADAAGHRLDDLGVEAIFSTAEVLYEEQRDALTRLTGARVVNNYGSREGGFIAQECPEGNMHVTSENVIVEVIRGAHAAPPGEDGEIVVTQLDNFAMPLIRYRTGDIGQLAEGVCPCGRGLGLMKVVKGRSNDFLIAPDGRYVHGSAVGSLMREIPGVESFQVRQAEDYSLEILVVTPRPLEESDSRRIVREFQARLGEETPVRLTRCDAIPVGSSGKHRYVISERSLLE